MSRFGLVLLSLLATATLPGCASTPLSTAAPASATVRAQPAPPPAPVRPPEQPVPQPDPEIVVTPLQPSKEIAPVEPHLALLLPLISRDFGRAAQMVREGFEAAATVQSDNPLPVKIYPLDDEGDALLATYKQAVALGARCIVAGLTRDGALTLAASGGIKVPTLTLNQVDQLYVPTAPFYTLTLSLEDEARQVVALITSQGFSKVAILTGPSPLSRRIRDAFEQAWIGAGREITVKLPLSRDATEYGKFRVALQTADSIFLASESSLARQVTPYIARGMPVFSTSQIYDGKTTPGATVDLQGIRFVDMPWLVDFANAAVAIYPRSSKPVSAEFDRLYALGIDAYRLAYLLASKDIGAGYLDGVTGTITLRDGYRFQRELVPVYFEGEQAVPLKSPTP